MAKSKPVAMDKLIHVLEWLYTQDGNYDNRHEWRHDLVQHLYWLADVKQVCCEEDCECE